VHFGIVGSLNVSDIEETRIISVDFFECLYAKVFSVWVHSTSNLSEELVIINFVVAIAVKFFEKFFTFGGGDFNSEITEGFPEFLNVKSTTTIVIHDFEHSL
jgi:hypothetical protein